MVVLVSSFTIDCPVSAVSLVSVTIHWSPCLVVLPVSGYHVYLG
jgi:hypothetical protein